VDDELDTDDDHRELHVISSEGYLVTVRDRMREDGCTITYETVGPAQALVGYRSDVKALSKMHLFTVVAGVPEVDEPALRDFTHLVSDYAKAQKGAARGMQSGVLAFAVLVAPKVDDGAKAVAAKPFQLGMGGFAAIVQPAVVDLTEGRVHTFRGRRLWGAAFAGYLRKKSLLYLPDPA
jgi:hypothetical protein